jgi:ribosomal protein S6
MDKDKKIQAFETIIIFHEKLTAKEYNSKIIEYQDHILKGDISWYETIPSNIYKINKMGKKSLAYKVKGCKTGWYVVFTYKTTAERVSQLEKFLRTDDTVIKYLSMKLSEDEAELLNDEDIISEQHEDYNPDPPKKEIDAFDLIFGEI